MKTKFYKNSKITLPSFHYSNYSSLNKKKNLHLTKFFIHHRWFNNTEPPDRKRLHTPKSLAENSKNIRKLFNTPPTGMNHYVNTVLIAFSGVVTYKHTHAALAAENYPFLIGGGEVAFSTRPPTRPPATRPPANRSAHK